MIKSTFSKAQTKNIVSSEVVERNTTNGTMTDKIMIINKSVRDVDGINVIGIITVCVLIGIATSQLKQKAKVFQAFFIGATEVIILILRWAMWTTPLGVFSLIAVAVASVTELTTIFQQLGLFVITVTVGVFLETTVVLPVILFVTTRRNPYMYLISMLRPWLIALATAMTAVAIPEMLNSCEVKNKIDKRVARFVIPLCTAINADGSAVFITTSVIFIAKLTSAELYVTDYIVVCLLTGISSLALPSVPSASIVVLILVLTSLNISPGYVSLLFAVEWFLDRIRTACNLLSHTVCAAVTYQFCKNDLKNIDMDIPCDDFEIDVEKPGDDYGKSTNKTTVL